MTTTEHVTLHVTRLSPHASAPRSAASTLTRPLSEVQVRAVHDALIAHGVIFFRDQQIDMGQLKALGRLLRRAAYPFGPAGAIPTIPRCGPCTRTRPPSTLPARSGTPTAPAIRFRRWVASFTCTRYRRSAAIRCSAACTRPTRHCQTG